MLNAITYEKVEEVIALAKEARERPLDTSAQCAPPRAPRPQTRPQPAPDWARAFPGYLSDLSGQALAELEALYRFGRGDAAGLEEAIAAACGEPRPEAERVAFLGSRPDLDRALAAALEKLV